MFVFKSKFGSINCTNLSGLFFQDESNDGSLTYAVQVQKHGGVCERRDEGDVDLRVLAEDRVPGSRSGARPDQGEDHTRDRKKVARLEHHDKLWAHFSVPRGKVKSAVF